MCTSRSETTIVRYGTVQSDNSGFLNRRAVHGCSKAWYDNDAESARMQMPKKVPDAYGKNPAYEN